MRFFLVLTATALLSWLALFLLPWWVPMPIAFLLVLAMPMKKWRSFLSPALGCSIGFMLLTTFRDLNNHHLLSEKIAQVFHLPSFMFLILISGIIGFITAGLGGWTAAAFLAFYKKK